MTVATRRREATTVDLDRGPTRSDGVTVDGLSKRFAGGVTALDEVCLACGPGQVLALVGPSGCGKTTLLRCIAGLEQPTSGVIRIDGRLMTDIDPQHRGVAMVFQDYALYPNKTAAQNIEFPLRMAKVPRARRAERVAEVAKILRIESLLDRRPAEMSGGQKQRVGIGRALARRPTVLLMDEPLSNLDAQLRVEMRAELLALQRSLGLTTIYVTHDQTEAMTLGDRLAMLCDGRVEQVGTPSEVFAAPATTTVAAFLGGMNLVPGETEGDEVVVGGRSGSARMRVPAAAGMANGKRVVVGVRPEHLVLGGGSDHSFQADGEITLVELLGAEQLVHLRLAGDGQTIRIRVPVGVPLVAQCHAAPEYLHLFDAENGRRWSEG